MTNPDPSYQNTVQEPSVRKILRVCEKAPRKQVKSLMTSSLLKTQNCSLSVFSHECVFTLPPGVVDRSGFTSTVDIHMPLWKNMLLSCVAYFVIKHLIHGIPFNHQNINCPVLWIKPALDETLTHPQSEVPFSRFMPLTRVLDAKLTKDTEWGPKLIKVRDKVEYIITGIREIQKIIRAYFENLYVNILGNLD